MIHGLENQLGRSPAIVLSYKDWTQAPFVYGQLDDIWNTGAVPMITWEPWVDDESGVPLGEIAAGAYDGYLSDAARAAAGWGRPLMLRFAQEPNGDWFPWGGRPAVYRAAWRHMHRIFEDQGATNVRWIWTPYVDSGGDIPFAKYYPGDRFVDWAGLDGINWGGTFPWRSFRDVFAASYQELLDVTAKPLVLAETGSGESGGSKSRWISTMLNTMIPRMSHVRAIVFWSVDDHRGDIRVDSSAGALAALQRSLRNPLYRSSRTSVNRVPKRLR
jgi:beta-mannanase